MNIVNPDGRLNHPDSVDQFIILRLMGPIKWTRYMGLATLLCLIQTLDIQNNITIQTADIYVERLKHNNDFVKGECGH